MEDLETAIEKQASFWKLVGILTLLSIVMAIVWLVGGVGTAIMMGASN
ncbi:MAG: hypothetical protein R3E89_15035 [Thiolinea sp.]